jgi:hypothetical protein
MRSIIQPDKSYCFICGRNAHADYWGLDEHHCFGGGLRKASERYGLKVYLCHETCHLGGVHKDKALNRLLQAKVQRIAMAFYGWTEQDFIKIFRKNYL